MLVDVYNKWTGPCIAAETYLRGMKHEANGLVLVRACCDQIEELYDFRGYVKLIVDL
jgi:hypothetical protein